MHATSYGETVHLDFAGPLFGKLHILIFVDNYTGIVRLVPTYSERAETVAFALLHHWYPNHSMPRSNVTDRGKGFIAEANRTLYKKLAIKKLAIKKLFTSS